MTTPVRHRDTYIEECHRNFFSRYARGVPLRRGGTEEKHIGGLVGILPIAAFHRNQPDLAEQAALEHLSLTHPGPIMEAAASLLVHVLLEVLGGKSLKDVLENLDIGDRMHPNRPPSPVESGRIRPRQLTGQPAGPWLAMGRARVVRSHADLADFAQGEILVCDAVDPNMTFVVPLAAAVVERRGGMLIHGAIIAREYGLPCVSGIPDATSLVQSGDLLTVDGYLGILTVGSGEI
jgi:phosphohistidine swiveling domain-containing protein